MTDKDVQKKSEESQKKELEEMKNTSFLLLGLKKSKQLTSYRKRVKGG